MTSDMQPRGSRSVEVVALGDVTVDLIAHFQEFPVRRRDTLATSIELHCGGSAANTAMVLARLGFGVRLISRLGSDPLASIARHSLREAGVDLSGLQRDATAMTGLIYIVVTPDGGWTMLSYRGASALTEPQLVHEASIEQARLFHLSGYALLAEPQRSAALRALELAVHAGLATTLDPGFPICQAAPDELRRLLPAFDLLLPNLAEAQALTGLTSPHDCVRALIDQGAWSVAVKLGRDGCLIGSQLGLVRVPAFAVQARDSTGAGDSFNAGVIAAYLQGLDWHCAAVLGNALGALAASQEGSGALAASPQQVATLLEVGWPDPAFEEHRHAVEHVIQFMRAPVAHSGQAHRAKRPSDASGSPSSPRSSD